MMNPHKHSILHSFSGKMTACILCVATAVFVLVFWGYYKLARGQVEHEAVRHAESALSTTVMQMNKILESVEIAVENMSWAVTDQQRKEDLYDIVQRLVENNPFISGSAIAFEPNSAASDQRFYAPFAYRKGNRILTKQLGSETYRYHQMEWYTEPERTGKPQWCEPYIDEGGGNILMTTYSLPLFDRSGNFYGVFTADLSLHWLTETLNELKPYPHSFNVMMGKKGVFIVHPKKEMILKENAFTAATTLKPEELRAYGRQVMRGEKGMLNTYSNGKPIYIFFAPVEKSGWFVSVVCPQDEIFESVDRMRRSVLVVFTLGLIVMAVLCFYVIRRLTDPLQKFAQSAIHIAEGDFQTQLPAIHSHDEMRTLHDSFAFMQQSLVHYMEQLKETTAKQERIDSELRIASAIQMGMLPKQFPAFPDRKDIDIYAQLIPAKEVGGDLYHFFLKGERLLFCVGDVSGKGIPASLIMSVICRALPTVAEHFVHPSEILKIVNGTLAERNDSSMFCTLFLGMLELDTGRLVYCNAGHNAPLLVAPCTSLSTDQEKPGTVTSLHVKPNLPLGVFDEVDFEEQEMILPEGSSLFLYTDGVTEAENGSRQLYSVERLQQQLTATNGQSPELTIQTVLTDVRQFVGDAAQSDDITVLCLKYLGSKFPAESI